MTAAVSSLGHTHILSRTSNSPYCRWLSCQKPSLGVYQRHCRILPTCKANEITEALATELANLDAHFEALKDKLKSEESIRSEIEESLVKTVEELKIEQQTWVVESQKVKQMMAQAERVRTSEEDLQLLREKQKSLQKRLEITSALIEEREREIGSLESQLENVKMMGEMKSLKARPAKQLVEAVASRSVEDGFADLQQTRTAWVNPPSQAQRSSFINEGGSLKSALPPVIQGVFSPRDHTNGMEMPGIILASAIVGGSELAKAAWGSVKSRLSPEIGASIEILATCASIAAVGSVLVSG